MVRHFTAETGTSDVAFVTLTIRRNKNLFLIIEQRYKTEGYRIHSLPAHNKSLNYPLSPRETVRTAKRTADETLR